MAQVVDFYRRTRRRKVLKEVKERYIRDDLGCGTMHGLPLTPSMLSALISKKEELFGWIVPDTNVVLHQFDLLEHASLKCAPLDRLVISQTLVDEVKHNDKALFRRLCALVADERRGNVVFANEHCSATASGPPRTGESINDRNDRAIRDVALFLSKQLGNDGHFVNVLLLTDDRACRALAKKQGLKAMSTAELCQALTPVAPHVGDLLATRRVDEDEKKRGRAKLYEAHLGMAELLAGVASKRFVQGPLRCAKRTCWKAFVLSEAGEDILVESSPHINRAVDGDIVGVELFEEGAAMPAPVGDDDDGVAAVDVDVRLAADRDDGDAQDAQNAAPHDGAVLKVTAGQLRGRVVGVIKRNWRQNYCGSIEIPGNVSTDSEIDALGRALFVPVDRRCPKVVVESRQLSRLARQRILVAMDVWRDDSRWPSGHFVAALGYTGEKAVETDVLLREHDIATAEFSTEVLACLPPQGEDFVIDEALLENRIDLRGLTICSIDPPGCRDIDDALHAVGPLENGAYQVGIHIADVTHFCKAGSALDVEAAKRGTSTYLVERRLDMLPVLLTANLCRPRLWQRHMSRPRWPLREAAWI
ncbi:hypothetical protein M885DRAFT_151464 [Pelagophyceae sp. CCMP2097]|nr:hypothetical protein M885DRAFT_151464 [Pelagophyceae sp. CCMP2097]